MWPPLLWNQTTCTNTVWERDKSPTTAFIKSVQSGNRLNRNESKCHSKDFTPVCTSFNNLPQRQVHTNTNSYNHGRASCCKWWKKWSRPNHAWCCPTATSTPHETPVSVGREREMLPTKWPQLCNSTQAIYLLLLKFSVCICRCKILGQTCQELTGLPFL